MTIPREIIEAAIEGGWSDGKHIVEINRWGVRLLAASGYAQWEFKFEEIVCDPTFWQALGKHFGWNEIGSNFDGLVGDWQWQAERFFHLLLTNKLTDECWKELTSL